MFEISFKILYPQPFQKFYKFKNGKNLRKDNPEAQKKSQLCSSDFFSGDLYVCETLSSFGKIGNTQ